MTWIVLGTCLAGCLLLVLAERLLLNPRALVTVEDAITAVGKPIVLRVQVERDILPFWDPPLPGVEVTFAGAGTAKTGADGRAELVLPAADAPGHRRYATTIAGPLAPEPADLLVDVVAADMPVVVIDIDLTVANATPLGQAMKENRQIRPIAGAVEGVKALAARFAVVFLTARDHVFRFRTIEWLQENGFPDAPVLLRRRRIWRQSAADHKRERLGELVPVVRLAVGIGDLAADAAVYRERGMRAYILGRATADGAVTVRDWRALLEDLDKSSD
jgi:hypothetical protein